MAHSPRFLHKVISLCKRRGFITQLSDGSSGKESSYAYGPLGAELKKNIINEWWHSSVTSTNNVHGIDSNILTSLSVKELTSAIDTNVYRLLNPHAGNPVSESTSTHQSNVEDDVSNSVQEGLTHKPSNESDSLFLRPSIRQGGLVYMLECIKSLNLKPPFGIAEVGKVFRSHTSSKRFIFESQEYECMGVQFLCPPSEEREWYSHWQKKRLRWWRRLARNPEKFTLGEGETSNGGDMRKQSTVQYEFPWGNHDVESISNRGDADLKRLVELLELKESSLKSVKVKKEKMFPFLISLSAGVDRAVLAYLCDAYNEVQRPSVEKDGKKAIHTVLKLHTSLSPYKVAVLPADETNQKLCMYCKMLTEELRHASISTVYSESGTFHSRLALQDEVGTPYRIVADDKTLDTGIVTLQDRDTTGEEDMNGRDVLPSIQRMLFGARIN